MRTTMIAGNWKMHNGSSATSDFINKLEEWFASAASGLKAKEAVATKKIEVVVAPTFTSIGSAVSAKKSDAIEISAQNVHHEPKGAFTGEISISMLEEAGCKYVIIGHSERRHVFGESNDLLEKKLTAVLNSKLLPIFCVGELLEERESGNMKKVLEKQLNDAWAKIEPEVIGKKVVIAYEPVWAIGTGKTASNSDAQEACEFIRALAKEKFGNEAAESLRILYGGSVKPDNSAGILSQKDIDGLLIGGASLEVESFSKIIESSI